MMEAADAMRSAAVVLTALVVASCAGADSPVSPPPAARPVSDAALTYVLTLEPAAGSAYRASLRLTWQTRNAVGFGVEFVDVGMRAAGGRFLMRDFYGPPELAAIWGSNRVLALGRESHEFTTVFTDAVPFVSVSVTTKIVDSFDNHRVFQLQVSRDGFGMSAN